MRKIRLLLAGGFTAMALFGTATISAAEGFSSSTLPPGESATFQMAPLSITQSAALTVQSLNSVSCNYGPSAFYHANNSYLRRFNLASFGIVGPFTVNSVDIGVEQATSGAGTQPVTVNLYSIPSASALMYANLTLIGTATVNVADQSLTLLNIPVAGLIATPAALHLVVEIFTPDGSAAGNTFFIGSNNLGQSAPSYLAAADCTVVEPTDTAALGFPGMHIVMVVNGNETPTPTAQRTLGAIRAMYR